jgi:hypothetical protein
MVVSSDLYSSQNITAKRNALAEAELG